ncbi:MAG: ATP-dependent helicase, partial [Myxococcaceae bacterium]|nr:ATP-dependent helicase [Myxococcaceae bacterium]
NVPFWRGEAPARTDELSAEVARLRQDVIAREDAHAWLEGTLKLPAYAADLLVRYLRAGAGALGGVPTLEKIYAERFFDDAGGMQLIIHSPYGGRINRAWGLALRKSFCRAFDFELQAAATDDGLILSLGEQHSFALEDIFDFVHPNTVEQVLTQAVLQAPIFGTRFRWTSSRALALSRMSGGKRVPPPIQRARSEDLMAAVFPEQVGCADNHGGKDIEPPDHPLVNESLKDCLRDAMDVDGLKAVLVAMKEGRIQKIAVDLPEPSVFAHAMLNSAPYTYLDEAPLEERRARAVSVRRTLPEADAANFGALDAAAISQTIADARPDLREPEELHDLLLQLGCLPLDVSEQLMPPIPSDWLAGLIAARRAGVAVVNGRQLAYAAERVPLMRALFPSAELTLAPLPGDGPVEEELAARTVVRGWMEILGPTTAAELAALLGLTPYAADAGLAKLEQVGQVLRGRFHPGRPVDAPQEWCDRRLLQRIHRLTIGRLRREIEPLSAQDFMRFLFRWHHIGPEGQLRGTMGVLKAVSLLQGYEAPAAAWELELLPVRMKQYVGEWLEQLSWNGEIAWGRLTMKDTRPVVGPRRGDVHVPPPEPARRAPVQGRNASLSFVRRAELEWLLQAARPNALLADGPRALPEDLSPVARDLAQVLERKGASFFSELQSSSRRLPSEVEDALWELLARGLVTADAVQNLRVLQSPKLRRRQRALQRGGPGRWSLLAATEQLGEAERLEKLARLFLQRYGIVFRDLVARETLAPPWRELLPIYRRLEGRGEIRGGRFLAGFAGEQFALPEAVEAARATRRAPFTRQVVHLSAVDPLNLTGVVTPGPRVPAVMGHYVTYVDGIPQAAPGDDAVAR